MCVLPDEPQHVRECTPIRLFSLEGQSQLHSTPTPTRRRTRTHSQHNASHVYVQLNLDSRTNPISV